MEVKGDKHWKKMVDQIPPTVTCKLAYAPAAVEVDSLLHLCVPVELWLSHTIQKRF